MTTIERTIARIRPTDAAAAAQARLRQRTLTKPAGSLGALERLHVQLSGILRDPLPTIELPVILVCAADHGVADEAVRSDTLRPCGTGTAAVTADGYVFEV